MLKRIFIYSVLLLSAVANAADKDNFIAVINVEKLGFETKAGKSIGLQINDLQNKLQDKYTKTEKEFLAIKDGLDKKRAVLSKEAISKKEADFSNKVSDARKEIQKDAANIEQMQQAALLEFNTIALEVVQAIAKEEGYLQVIPVTSLIYATPQSDITSQVIAGMDKKLDNIALKTPTENKK